MEGFHLQRFDGEDEEGKLKKGAEKRDWELGSGNLGMMSRTQHEMR